MDNAGLPRWQRLGAWCIAVAVASAAASQAVLRDPDSKLYASIERELANAPLSRWIAPEWPVRRVETGPFHEHLAVFFWPGALLEKIGVPMGALVFNLLSAAGLCLALRALARSNRTPGADDAGSAADLAPVAWLVSPFGIQYLLRANHEVPWAACTVVAWAALLSGGRRSSLALAAAAAGAFLVKGMLALLLFPAAIAVLAARKELRARVPALALAAAAMGVAAGAYELLYWSATGQSFFAAYVRNQLAEVAEAEQLSPLWKLINPLYYAGMGLWFALPTTALLLVAVVARRRPIPPAPIALVFGWIVPLSVMTRSAIRYAFPPLAALHAAVPALLPERLSARLSRKHAEILAPALFAAIAVAHVVLDPYVARHFGPGR
jgi:hypothetical protein